MKFRNPIIPGFNPDPSVVLHNGTFFLVTSSFHMFPGLPIYSSTDLNSWTHLGSHTHFLRWNLAENLIGNAISRPGQITLKDATTKIFPNETGSPIIATTGLWAPTIRYYKNVFYIICTNTTSDGSDFSTQNFYITCSDIRANNWSDPILFDFDGIDPSLYFEDDRAYIQGCWSLHSKGKQPTCIIKQLEVDIKTGIALSETKELWEGFANIDSEGPHIYKKDGWYYLLIAEGGTFEHHMLSIARSRDIWGPYESYEDNPIMTSDGKDEYIQNAGHGELFQDTERKWWAAVLGIRNENGRVPLGRETFLTAVEWPENGWPIIQQPKMEFEREVSRLTSTEVYPVDPDIEFLYLRDPDLHNYKFSDNFCKISLRTSETDLSTSYGTTTFLGKRQRDLECSVSTTLELCTNLEGKEISAGLTIFKDEFRHALICVDFRTSAVNLSVVNKATGISSTIKGPVAKLVRKISFEIQATKLEYTFLFRLEHDGDWVVLGNLDSKEMTAREFTGTMFGVFANGKANAVGAWVNFRDFEQISR